jgi:hypothetical protein
MHKKLLILLILFNIYQTQICDENCLICTKNTCTKCFPFTALNTKTLVCENCLSPNGNYYSWPPNNNYGTINTCF